MSASKRLTALFHEWRLLSEPWWVLARVELPAGYEPDISDVTISKGQWKGSPYHVCVGHELGISLGTSEEESIRALRRAIGPKVRPL